MATGPNGRHGRDAVSRVAVDDSRGPELAPTPLRNMAVKNAAELKKKHELAMIFHAQVNEFRFFPLRFIKRIFNSVIDLVVEKWPVFFLWKDSSQNSEHFF